MEEIWKDIKGYEGKYQVSNMGRVRSCVASKGKEWRIMRQGYNRRGYASVMLGSKVRREVHPLVARAFVDGYQSGLVVNHKDENPANNRFDNLEWITPHENQMYGTGMERSAIKRRKPVCQVDNNGTLIKTYGSITDAAVALGVTEQAIAACCKGKFKTVKGYRLLFASKPETETRKMPVQEIAKVEDLDGEEWKEIAGFEGRYLVSNMGRIKSVKGRMNGEQIIRAAKSRDGSLRVSLISNDGHKRSFIFHRIVARAFCDGYSPSRCVRHKDGNSSNNRADNLEWHDKNK